jgi:hypothetical protein
MQHREAMRERQSEAAPKRKSPVTISSVIPIASAANSEGSSLELSDWAVWHSFKMALE